MYNWSEKLPKELWQHIFHHFEGIESLAAMAAIHERFYKWINRDFKLMCYRDGIYRFKGETWAKAFRRIAVRLTS
ncbi:unnamed protein product [Bursaphelenchus okinawaensis]|uniref:F-box domain-containing protein n=1 Tax=Bursaphelenchus okinawaensis TaxID=465554 RepID=A0A811KQX3_9BILA|nr:unnamed protein product [Bursaphelenchus okinawaensis]CAG9108323.1 unnamed protein product [Bursaphelenchus okinawaensis]